MKTPTSETAPRFLHSVARRLARLDPVRRLRARRAFLQLVSSLGIKLPGGLEINTTVTAADRKGGWWGFMKGRSLGDLSMYQGDLREGANPVVNAKTDRGELHLTIRGLPDIMAPLLEGRSLDDVIGIGGAWGALRIRSVGDADADGLVRMVAA
jgi:hypothetical protein